MAIQSGLALHCEIRPQSIFARKNYFYPDLPKGYQISQYDRPIAEHGYVDIVVNGDHKRVGITRAHMEDDAGKSQHEGFRDSDRYTYVDLNRSGTPLVEIVTEPDMRSSDEAFEFLTALKQIMQYVGVSACDMEKGQLRCDANVSVRLRGAPKFGTKAEVKNLNSFRFLKAALEYEVARQVGLLESGGRVVQETRLYNPETGETAGMRSKEEAHDYRYFPEPDLLPLWISTAWLDRAKATMPELPADLRDRFLTQYGLPEYDAAVLTATRELAQFYDRAAKGSENPKATANWIMGDLLGALKAEGKEITESLVTPEQMAELTNLIAKGDISGKLAKEIFPKMLATGESPSVIMEREGLRQISDSGALEKIVNDVIAASPKQVEQYRGGKTTVIGYFVGQVMKSSRSQANPAAVTELLKAKLG
jgi:aspartyl-tRNA(Asn)/glutamyl-tRNA(Gln) amidotransferase subunit B